MIGFVDVPGHIRFIKNMLAGVGAVEVAMLVVAANEGWMPQTDEHARILELLGVEHGLVVLTKADLVDAETLELAQLELEDRLAGRTLGGWPVVVVDALSGRGARRGARRRWRRPWRRRRSRRTAGARGSGSTGRSRHAVPARS